jgi:hypothetical protein
VSVLPPLEPWRPLGSAQPAAREATAHTKAGAYGASLDVVADARVEASTAALGMCCRRPTDTDGEHLKNVT